MKKGLLIFALLAPPIVPNANAQLTPDVLQIQLSVTNHSGECAWVTPYWSRPGFPWLSAFAPEPARWAKPGQELRFFIMLPDMMGTQILTYEVKVLAEFMSDGKCSHPVVSTSSAQNKSISRMENREGRLFPKKLVWLRSTLDCHRNRCSVSQPLEGR